MIGLGLVTLVARGQVNITTRQVDLAHTGVNSLETILTPANVSASGGFGLLFTHPLDGQCYGEPLYVSGLKLPDNSIHNVVYVATEQDGVYAFDADNITGNNAQPLWYDSLLPSGTTSIPQGDTETADITPVIGITGTPVIDLTTNTMYVVTADKVTANTTYNQYLHALDITTGAEKFGGPVLISATFHGTGGPTDTVVNGTFTFNPLRQNNRGALVLYNGLIYIAFASHGDVQPYHGLILAYNASNPMTLAKQFIDTPNGIEGGIWESGTGPAIDSAGNMYFATGNGAFDQNTTTFTTDTDWGESYLKLPTSGTFDVASANTLNWFTPNSYAYLNSEDLDLGSSGVLLLPDQTGPYPHLLVSGGKQGVLYVIDRDSMGGLNTHSDNSVQEIDIGLTFDCTPSYFNGYIYYAPGTGSLTQRSVGYNPVTGNYIGTTGIKSTNTYNLKGQGIFISANGTTNGMCWIADANTPSTVDVYNATSVAGPPIYEYTTQIPGSTVTNCTVTKFNLMTVANGKLYLTAYDANNLGHLFVLGLLTGATTVPTAPSNLVATPSSSSEVTLNWTDNSNNESGFKVERASQAGGPFTQIALTGANIPTFSDTGLTPQTTYYYKVVATNNVGDSTTATNVSSATTFAPYTPTGLVAYWNFDEGSGTTANDVTGNGHTGTLEGEVGWIPGFINSAINFHGSGNAISNVTVPNASTLQFSAAQSFTLSAWVQPGGLRSTDEAVIAKSRDQGNYYGIWINSSNQWVFRGPGGDVVGPTATVSAWTHVAVVQDGSAGTRTIYINGVAAGSGVAQAADGAGNLWIGQANGVTQPFPGAIDEVRLYNYALTPSQITTLLGPPVLQAVSRMTNGGNYDLVFPTNSTIPIECRQGATAGSYSLVLTFSGPVSGITATLGLQAGQSGTVVGSAGSVSYDTSGRIVTVPLTGVGDAQRLNLHLTGIVPGNGTADIPLNLLVGDTNGDGAVTSTDIVPIRNAYGLTYGQTGFNIRADTNGDGAVSSLDLVPVRNYYGTSLP